MLARLFNPIPSPQQHFIMAASLGDLATVELFLANGTINALNIDDSNPAGYTALQAATENNQVAVVRRLLRCPGIIVTYGFGSFTGTALQQAKSKFNTDPSYAEVMGILNDHEMTTIAAIQNFGADFFIQSKEEIYRTLDMAYASPHLTKQEAFPLKEAVKLGNFYAVNWTCLNAGWLWPTNVTNADSALLIAVDRFDNDEDVGWRHDRSIEDILISSVAVNTLQTKITATAAGNLHFLQKHCNAHATLNDKYNARNKTIISLLKSFVKNGDTVIPFWEAAILEQLRTWQGNPIDATEVMLAMIASENRRTADKIWKTFFLASQHIIIDFDKVTACLLETANHKMLAWAVVAMLKVTAGEANVSTTVVNFDKAGHRTPVHPTNNDDKLQFVALLREIPPPKRQKIIDSCDKANTKTILQNIFHDIRLEEKELIRYRPTRTKTPVYKKASKPLRANKFPLKTSNSLTFFDCPVPASPQPSAACQSGGKENKLPLKIM